MYCDNNKSAVRSRKHCKYFYAFFCKLECYLNCYIVYYYNDPLLGNTVVVTQGLRIKQLSHGKLKLANSSWCE